MPRILKFQTPSNALPVLNPIINNASILNPITLAGNYQLGQMSNYDIQKRDRFYRQAFNRSYDSFNKLNSDKQQQLWNRYEDKNTSGGFKGKNLLNSNIVNSIGDLLAKSVDAIMDATGMQSNQISEKVKEKTGITGAARFLNNAMNFIPGNPLAMGGKKITNAEISQEAENLRGAYTEILNDMDTAQSIGGSRINFMLSGSTRNTMDNYVKEQNRKNELLTNIGRTNTLRKQNDYAQEINKQNINRFSGNTYQNMTIGKEGLKLPNREMLDAIYAKRVTSFKDGGVIGVDSNVIPEGALHKELNHMEEYNEELDKVITDKGIAVVTTDKDGKVEQVAEIEKEEIVFRLELTKKIEELWHNGSQEAMLKAGKLLVKEIMGNTDDNTEEILDGDN